MKCAKRVRSVVSPSLQHISKFIFLQPVSIRIDIQMLFEVKDKNLCVYSNNVAVFLKLVQSMTF